MKTILFPQPAIPFLYHSYTILIPFFLSIAIPLLYIYIDRCVYIYTVPLSTIINHYQAFTALLNNSPLLLLKGTGHPEVPRLPS